MKSTFAMDILNKMDPFLNQGQYLQLTTVLLDALNEVEIIDKTKDLTDLDNFKLLEMFLSAKEIEGRSASTIRFYRLTINRLLKSTDKRIDQITTEDLRQYLTNHQRENNSSKTTRIAVLNRFVTPKKVKEILSDENLEVLRDNCESIRDWRLLSY